MNRDRLQDIYRNTHLADKTDIETIRQMTVDYPYYNLPYVILSKYYHDTQHYKFEDMLRQAALRVKDRQALYDYIHGHQSEEEQVPVDIAIERIESEVEPQIQEQVSNSVDAFLSDFKEGVDIDQSSDLTEPVKPVEEQLPEPLVEPEIINDLQEHTHIISQEIDSMNLSAIDNSEESLIAEPVNLLEEKPVEFVLDTHSESPALDKIEIDHDIIGEEIETEFSFSKSFNESIDNTENANNPITNVVDEDILEEAVIVDNTHASIEELHAGTEGDNYFKDKQDKQPEEESEPVSHMDFFAWLKAPKPESKSIIEEPITPLEPVTEEEAEVIVESNIEREPEEAENDATKPGFNLDLIDKFIQSNPQITRPKKEFFNPENMAKKSEVIDLEFVSETLANIYYEQGNYELALKAYEKLSLQNPSKQAYFADLIEKIRKERK